WSPGHPGATVQAATAVRSTGQTASLTTSNQAPQTLTYSAQWSQWGVLRKAPFEKDGQAVYVLENRQGQAILYVTCQPGRTLRDYLGRMVALYGPITYRSDDYLRTHFMTPS